MSEDPGALSYPKNWEADVVLADGRTCHIRPVRPSDGPALTEFYAGLSDDTLYLRFFTANEDLSARDIDRLLKVDHRDSVGLIALTGSEIIGIADYDRADRVDAEIAFTIRDDNQGRGLGSVLLEHLSAIARENGIHRFRAEVLSSNKAMLATFTAAGYSPTQALADGIAVLDFDIDPTAKSRSVARAREHRAEALSIQTLVAPNRVAVICDSIDEGSIGLTVTTHLLAGGFTGQLVVIHPTGADVGIARGFSSLAAAREAIDVAVVALAPDDVESVIGECARAGVRGIVLLAGGFVENRDYQRQRRLVHQIREYGMRLIGPNALGLINTDPRISLNASLVPEMPGRGRIGFFCQTGAFGSAILREAQRRGLGISTFISAGNRADVSANDMLQYWEEDDSTALVLLYLESIGNPRKFTRIARRLALTRPVVAVRSGRSTQSLPLGHSVRHTELPAAAVDAMFDQAGVIQVDTLSELLDLAGLLAFQPLPRGPRVAVISDTDALGVLALDAAESLGLEPVGDVRIAESWGTAAEHEALIAEALADPGVDAIVVTHTPPVFGTDDLLQVALANQSKQATKPLIAVVLAQHSEPIVSERTTYGMPGHGSVPVFPDVETALRALRSVVKYQQWLVSARGIVPEFSEIEQQRAHLAVVEPLLEHPGVETTIPLDQDQLTRILDAYGVELWPAIPVSSEEEAIAAAQKVGYPVVLKSVLARLVHRTDLGGVRLSLENEHSLRTAYLSMVATLPPDAIKQLVVQRMAPSGVACVAGTTEDPWFGPVVRFRLGGVIPKLLADYGYRIPPITDLGAAMLVRAPRASSLLFSSESSQQPGFESQDLDTGALEDLLARLGRLADDQPELARLELNPIVAHRTGVAVLGALGSVAVPQIRTDLEARRLL